MLGDKDKVEEYTGGMLEEGELPGMWANFIQMQRNKEERMSCMLESIRESHVLSSAVDKLEHTVPSAPPTSSWAEDDSSEIIGERKRKLLEERGKDLREQKERDAERQRAREAAAAEREQEARVERERIHEEMRKAKIEGEIRMQELERKRKQADESMREKMRELEEERRREEDMVRERAEREEQERGKIEELRAVRQVMKAKEDEKEKERARRGRSGIRARCCMRSSSASSR
jgi:hypothetical protein